MVHTSRITPLYTGFAVLFGVAAVCRCDATHCFASTVLLRGGPGQRRGVQLLMQLLTLCVYVQQGVAGRRRERLEEACAIRSDGVGCSSEWWRGCRQQQVVMETSTDGIVEEGSTAWKGEARL